MSKGWGDTFQRLDGGRNGERSKAVPVPCEPNVRGIHGQGHGG